MIGVPILILFGFLFLVLSGVGGGLGVRSLKGSFWKGALLGLVFVVVAGVASVTIANSLVAFFIGVVFMALAAFVTKVSVLQFFLAFVGVMVLAVLPAFLLVVFVYAPSAP